MPTPFDIFRPAWDVHLSRRHRRRHASVQIAFEIADGPVSGRGFADCSDTITREGDRSTLRKRRLPTTRDDGADDDNGGCASKGSAWALGSKLLVFTSTADAHAAVPAVRHPYFLASA
jgi:hypothetical protein